MVNEIPDSRFMMREFLRERKCFTDQSGNTLSEGIVKTFNIAGFSCLFANRFVTLNWQETGISLPEIGMDKGALAINRRQGMPQLLSGLPSRIP